MAHAELLLFLQDLSWSMYKPVASATKIVCHPEEQSMFKRTTFEPLTAEELGAELLDGAIAVRLSVGDGKIDATIGADGRQTTLRGVLDALDAALEQRPTAEMLADWAACGGLEAAEAASRRWQDGEGADRARGPTLFEAWDGNENALTVRHVIGNGCCAFFEGLSASDDEGGVFRVCIGT